MLEDKEAWMIAATARWAKHLGKNRILGSPFEDPAATCKERNSTSSHEQQGSEGRPCSYRKMKSAIPALNVGPEAPPNSKIVPPGRSAETTFPTSSPATLSRAAYAPFPPVMSRTRAVTSSSAEQMTWKETRACSQHSAASPESSTGS